MLNDKELDNLVNSTYAATLLVQNLSSLVKATNPLLSDIAIEILKQATQIEQRLKRIESIAHTEENSA
jgi:hypothetical protein